MAQGIAQTIDDSTTAPAPFGCYAHVSTHIVCVSQIVQVTGRRYESYILYLLASSL